MEIDLSNKNLTQYEKDEIRKLLKRKNHNIATDVEQMWYLMDLIWDDFGCNNEDLNWGKIGKFYSHPVWLLNGLFIEQHELSMQHRDAISDWIIENNFKKVVDYGGGFGTLARLIAQKNKNIHIDIVEPYPSNFGLKRAEEFSNIEIIPELNKNYDCLLSTDVLEHVSDPLKDFSKMIESVNLGGYLVIANAFYPMIKCHLPQDFHFRYTFNQFANMMGLEIIGKLEGSHATIFRKVSKSKLPWNKIRFYEKLSRIVFPVIEFLKPVLKPIKKVLNK